MTIVLHRHRRDEEPLLAPATHSGPAPELPAEAPFAPGRLGCTPGTSRDVIDVLRAETVGAAWERAVFEPANPAARIQHAWRMAVAPLETLLDFEAKPLPDTDWHDKTLRVEAGAHRDLSRLSAALVTHTNKALDLLENTAADLGNDAFLLETLVLPLRAAAAEAPVEETGTEAAR